MHMIEYNVAYEVAGKIQLYCSHNVGSHEEAEKYLNNFKQLYMKGDKGKRSPKGTPYPFRNPRIVKLEDDTVH